MKKVITLVALLSIATFSLSGCSWFQLPQEEEQPAVTTTDTEPLDEDTDKMIDISKEPTVIEPKDVTPLEPKAISDVITPIVTDKSFEDLKKGPFSIGSGAGGDLVTVEGDIMKVQVGYTACGREEFSAYWPPSFMESAPVQSTILLVMNTDPEDVTCQMFVGDEIKIDLTTVKEHYKTFYKSEKGTIILSVTDGDKNKETVTYEF